MNELISTDRDFALEEMKFRGDDKFRAATLSGERVQALTSFNEDMRRILYRGPNWLRSVTCRRRDGDNWDVVDTLKLPWDWEPETEFVATDVLTSLGSATRFHFTPMGFVTTPQDFAAMWPVQHKVVSGD